MRLFNLSLIKRVNRKLCVEMFFLAVLFFVQSFATADLEGSKRAFQEAEKAFYSASPTDCIPLFDAVAKELITEMKTRTLQSEERSLLERSFDYIAQTYFNQNDLQNAKASYVELLEINPQYQLNEELISIKVIDFFNTIKKEMLSPLSVTTTPSGAEVFLDGVRIGMSDLQSSAVKGEHWIEVKKPGFLPDKRQVNIVPPEPAVIEIGLKPDPAELVRSAQAFEQNKDLQNARDRYEQALSILKLQEATPQIADVYFRLGRILQSQKDLSNAVSYYEQAIALYEKEGDKKSQALALSKLAETLQESDRTDQAMERYQKVLTLSQDLGEKSLSAQTLLALGQLYESKKDWAKSKESYNAALTIYSDLKDPAGSGEALFHLGDVALQEKRLSDAMTHFDEARALFQQAQNQEKLELLDRKIRQIREGWKSRAVELLLQGYQRMNEKQYEEAEQKYKEALEAARDGADKSSQLGALLSLGFLIYQRHDVPTAKSTWEEALSLSREIGDKESEALALYDLSTIYYTLRDYPRAEDFYKQSEQLYQSIKMEPRKRPWESK